MDVLADVNGIKHRKNVSAEPLRVSGEVIDVFQTVASIKLRPLELFCHGNE